MHTRLIEFKRGKREEKVFLSYNISLFRFVSLWNKFWHYEIFKTLEKLFIFGIYRWTLGSSVTWKWRRRKNSKRKKNLMKVLNKTLYDMKEIVYLWKQSECHYSLSQSAEKSMNWGEKELQIMSFMHLTYAKFKITGKSFFVIISDV